MEATIDDFKVIPTDYSLLTDSLLKSEIVIDDNKEYTKKMLKKHAGAWVGDENCINH